MFNLWRLYSIGSLTGLLRANRNWCWSSFPQDRSIAHHSVRTFSFLQTLLSPCRIQSSSIHPHIHRSLCPIDDHSRLLTQLCEFSILVSLMTSNPCNRSRDRLREHLKCAQTFSTRDAMGDGCEVPQEAKNEL